jgi:hypothetical protein
MIPRLTGLLTAAFLVLPGLAQAIEIEEVTSPGGIDAWLVEDHSIPFVALDIWFMGGASLDAEGARGAIHLMTGLLEEGAADMDARAFAEAVEGLAASFEFDVYRDAADSVGADADREPRRCRQPSARRPDRAALRPGCDRTRARSGPLDHRARRPRS